MPLALRERTRRRLSACFFTFARFFSFFLLRFDLTAGMRFLRGAGCVVLRDGSALIHEGHPVIQLLGKEPARTSPAP